MFCLVALVIGIFYHLTHFVSVLVLVNLASTLLFLNSQVSGPKIS